jgi:hypothetical protein
VASIREEYDPELDSKAKMKRLDELTRQTSEAVAHATAKIDESVAESKERLRSTGPRTPGMR